MTTIGSNRVSELRSGQVRTYALDPFELGFTRAYSADLRGGDAGENAEITRQVLSGADQGARRDAVVLNAAAALVAGGKAAGMREGIRLAADSIDRGAAQAVMNRLVTFTQELAA